MSAPDDIREILDRLTDLEDADRPTLADQLRRTAKLLEHPPPDLSTIGRDYDLSCRREELEDVLNADNGPEPDESDQVRLVHARAFAAIDEPGAEPIAGKPGEVLIPRDADVMVYGDGGASKTTLGVDLAAHLAAGDDWLGVAVPAPVSVALIEAEGPRPLFRQKIRRKLNGWEGSELGGRLYVLEQPWADFRFPGAGVAERVAELEVDVLIVGPLTRVGWEAPGTLQEVRDFTTQMAEFRQRTGRPLTIIIIHHENRAGAVSGAWEGACDTLLHTVVHARGRTTLTIEKARWSGDAVRSEK